MTETHTHRGGHRTHTQDTQGDRGQEISPLDYRDRDTETLETWTPGYVLNAARGHFTSQRFPAGTEVSVRTYQSDPKYLEILLPDGIWFTGSLGYDVVEEDCLCPQCEGFRTDEETRG